ncbi:MAG TPA: ABC transporter ATP-binding protein [Polyangiaceae bacterium]|nr:ABC transporter ATP-binding protein [Polyangiaceae bacterium]
MNAIVVQNLSRHFGAFKAVSDVSFHVERGEIFGYLGANGAGKSTTIRMLCGLLAPSSGDAVVAGHPISRNSEGVKASIGYMSQKFSLYFELSVQDNLRFFGGAYGLSGRALDARIAETLEQTDLVADARRVTGSLPGGVRQRLALGCAVLHRPQIVFLDEPTAGVDPSSRRAFWRLIRELARGGTTIFVTTHYMDEAEYCARIGLMVGGRLIALDTPSELKRTFVPGRMFALRSVTTADVERLRRTPGVLGAELFGQGAHVRLDAGVMPEAIFGGRAEPSAIDANLEDVFLAAVASPKKG